MHTRTALVRGVGSHNGGAELLLRSSSNAIVDWGDRAVVDRRQVSSELRTSWGLGGYWGIQRFKLAAGTGADLLPRRLAGIAGVTTWRHVDYVLDASGFSYGDQWSAKNIEQVAYAAGRWRRRRVPFILLPQSFGPFERPDVRDASLRLFEHATQIWARDDVSLGHLTSLLGPDTRVAKAPDITISLHAPRSADPLQAGTVAVIPNINLATRRPQLGGLTEYSIALTELIQGLRETGARPVLLEHSTHGDPTVTAACARILPDIEVVRPADGLQAKAFIAECDAVVSGRYHGLVSALSSGVPAVAHSWSHKYEELMGDFGQSSRVVDPFEPPAALDAVSDLLSSDASETIRRSATGLREELTEMWQSVHTAIAR